MIGSKRADRTGSNMTRTLRPQELMNVVIVNDYGYVSGGGSKVAIDSAMALANSGIQVHFFCAIGPPLERLLSHPNIRFECLDHLRYTHPEREAPSRLKAIWDSEAEDRFRAFLRPLSPRGTVVHLHTYVDGLSPSVLSVPVSDGWPCVMSCHDYLMACPYGTFYNSRTNQICEKRGMSIGCLTSHCNTGSYVKKLVNYTRGAVQVNVAEIPGGIQNFIFVSKFCQRVLEPYLPNNYTGYVIPNPIRAEPGIRRKLTPNSKFVSIGGLVHGKDPITVALAARLAGVPIVFIGDGPLKEQVLLANPEAEVTGWLPSENVEEQLLSARALIFASRWYETAGMVVQEAASVGVPVVCSTSGAAYDYVSEKKVGVGFVAGDIEDLAKNMKELGKDEQADEWGTRAYDGFWSDPSTPERHLLALLDVYPRVLSDAL